MIDLSLLKQSHYTIAEIAAIYQLDAKKVASDLKRLNFPVVKRLVKRVVWVGNFEKTAKKPVVFVPKASLLKYHAYLRVKSKL